jgi:hypothetical protein
MQVNRTGRAVLFASPAAVHRLTAPQHEAAREALYAAALRELEDVAELIRARWEDRTPADYPAELRDRTRLAAGTLAALAALDVDPAPPAPPIAAAVAA